MGSAPRPAGPGAVPSDPEGPSASFPAAAPFPPRAQTGRGALGGGPLQASGLPCGVSLLGHCVLHASSPGSQSCSSAQGAPPGSPLPAPQPESSQVWGSPHWLSASPATFFPLLVSGVLQTISLYIVFALIIGGGRGDPVSVAPSYMEVESVCFF